MKNFFGKMINSKFGWLFLLVVLFAVNFLATKIHYRIDLTKEKRYTLSPATKDLLRSLEDVVEIDVLLKGEFPAGFRKLANSTEEFLQLIKDRNSSKIHYRFVSPQDEMPGTGKSYGDSLINLGAVPINLTVQKQAGESSNIIFPVALVKYQGREFLINLLSGASRVLSQDNINTAEALMEYQFVNALDKLTQTQRPGIAYTVGNGEPVDGRTYMMRTAFQKDYDFRILDLNSQPAIPASVNILIIVKP